MNLKPRSRSKSMYVVNHSLTPYFKSVLKTDLHKADLLKYSFDEILNDLTQTTEMDLYVHHWDPIKERVRFLRSHFPWTRNTYGLVQPF